MTIKQQGGIFGRNPTFNDLTVEGTLTATGSTSYTSIDVDNINIDGNTISSTDTNGNIALDPNGTGLVTAASDVKLFSQKKVILNRADNATAAEINYQGAAVGLVFNDLNGEGFKFQLGGSDKVVFNYLGNIVVNSGNGIDFSATSGTGTSELFDDYEEGTWTPVVVGSTTAGSATYTIQFGRYTKIGRMVYYSVRVGYSGHTGAGNMQVTGLPFTSANAYSAGQFSFRDGLTVPSSQQLLVSVVPNNTYVQMYSIALGTAAAATLTLGTAVTDFAFNGFYEAV